MHVRAARTQRAERRRDQGAAAPDRDLLRRPRRQHGLPDRPAGAGRDGGRDPRRSPMTESFLYAAARTPFGRFGGALAETRPDDLAADRAARRAGARPRSSTRPRSATSCWGNANGAGEDNRNVGRMAVLLAGPARLGPRDHGQPAVRLQPRRRHDGLAADRDRRRRRRGRRRGRVDDPRTVGAAQAVAGLPGGQRHRGLHDAGLAAGQREHARGLDGLPRRGQRAARRSGSGSPASGRTSSPPARTSSPPRPGTPASTTTSWSPVPAASSG